MASAALGIGLRVAHYADIVAAGLPCGFVEGITENFLERGGRPRRVLERVRGDGARLALHGVSLSVGGLAPLDLHYLDQVRTLADDVGAAWVSDHLCFGDAGQGRGYDLWPLPHDRATLDWVAERVARVQDRLRRRIVLENVSSYARWRHDEVPEWEALTWVAERADCLLLVDLNNILVNAHNHGFDPLRFLDGLPAARVAQHHLSGHRDLGTHRFDDHAHAVPDEVWALFRAARARFGEVPTIVEWDGDVPPLPRVLEEAATAEAIDAELRRAGALRGPSEPPVPAPASAPPATDPPAITAEALGAWWSAMRQELPLRDLSPRLTSHAHLRPRLHTYVSGFYVRQTDALAACFPRTSTLLGEAFRETVRAFVLERPSHEPALERLGAGFADFLDEVRADPVLAGVARVEWARNEALLAPEAAPVPPVAPEALPTATAVLHPSVRVVRLPSGVRAAWGGLGAEGPDPAAVVFWRAGSVGRLRGLAADEAEALERAGSGAAIDEVCGAFVGATEPTGRAAAVLGGWARAGILLGARPSPEPPSPEAPCSPSS